ncbi:DinB family protein [Actinoplanes italicus]|uniref:DinB family protein n=1 Tax=Actinoplanes italicus TaxID=113567 RepID=UPI0011B22049|nr:DinB family protein [Actinoplanes italicus]
MTEHTFEDQDLSGARFRMVSLRGARMHAVDLAGVKITDAWAVGVDISGMLRDVRLNGVDVVPLVEAELDRIHPQRAKMRPVDADGYREAWAILEQLWAATIARARGLDATLLHERVDGEWSFVETLRHLNFGTAAWALRAVLGEPAPWHPTDLPHDEMPELPGLPRDRRIQPSLDEVLAVRAGRVARVRELLAGLTDEQLRSSTTPVTEPGYPEPESFAVTRCLGAVINEHWEHRLYAERDLDVLTGR